MLKDDLIMLRALEQSDLDALYLWENNPDNWKVSHTLTPYSRHVLAQYIDTASDIFTDKQLRLLIVNYADGERIGAVDLFDCDFKNRRAGIGILIAQSENRGKGYASRTLDLLLPYCFETLGLHQVYCNILAENDQSLRLFEKYGFERIGLKKDWTLHRGIFHDEWTLQKVDSKANE